MVRLGWNLNSILTLLKACFLLIFRSLAPKNQKLRFFYVISVFLWRFVPRFLFREKYGDLNQNLTNLFHKMNHFMPYNIYLGRKRPLESILGHFQTHICKKGPKKSIFWNFLSGELIFQIELEPPLIVETTQIIALFIALCVYFEGEVTKICLK